MKITFSVTVELELANTPTRAAVGPTAEEVRSACQSLANEWSDGRRPYSVEKFEEAVQDIALRGAHDAVWRRVADLPEYSNENLRRDRSLYDLRLKMMERLEPKSARVSFGENDLRVRCAVEEG